MTNVPPPKIRTVKDGVPVDYRKGPRRLTADEIKAMLPPIDESRMVRETFSGQIRPGLSFDPVLEDDDDDFEMQALGWYFACIPALLGGIVMWLCILGILG